MHPSSCAVRFARDVRVAIALIAGAMLWMQAPAQAAPVWQFDAGGSAINHGTNACATNTVAPPPPPWTPQCPGCCVIGPGTGFGPQAFAPLGAFSYARKAFGEPTCPDSGTGLTFVRVDGVGTATVRIHWLLDARTFHNCDCPSPVWEADALADLIARVQLKIDDPSQATGTPQPVWYLWSAFSFNNYKPELGAPEDPSNVLRTSVVVNSSYDPFSPPAVLPASVWEPGLPSNFFDLPLLRGFRLPPAGTATFTSAINATVPVMIRGRCEAQIDTPGVCFDALLPPGPSVPCPPTGCPAPIGFSPSQKDESNTVFQGTLILSLAGPVDQSQASCQEPAVPCPSGASLPCTVDHPTPGCNDPSCCNLVCQINPACCVGPWTFDCVAIALQVCPGGYQACGAPGAGRCDTAHPSPGCSNPACCQLVCSYDVDCCQIEWDSLCVQLSQVICADCCPPGAVQEAEACDASTNGGCDAPGVPVQQITCGSVICGTSWATSGQFDTDWYQLTVPPTASGHSVITARLTSAFQGILLILDNACPPNIIGASESSLGLPGEASACVSNPGTYRVYVAPGTLLGGFLTTGLPCGSNNKYILQVTCPGSCPTPPNDLCANALTIGLGSTPFNTLGATTDGPPATSCGPLGADLWYRYSATCDGTLTVKTCNAANYDTMLAVYNGFACSPFGAELGCSDDTPACGATSTLTIPVVAGGKYLIRVGGFSGLTGNGTLTLSLQCACLADLNGDGLVNGIDLAFMLGRWTGPAAYLPCPPFRPQDLNHDCKINGLDLAMLLGAWGPCP